MFVTLSEAKFSEQIRQLEGISDTIEEITDRMEHYAGRLFQHLSRNHGVTMVCMVSQSGGLGTFCFALSPIYDDQDRADRISGLSLMNPNSVSVEQGDLEAFVPQGIVLQALLDEWECYESQLQKILPSQIPELLEQAAQRVMSMPASTMSFGDPELDEATFQDFLRRSGKRDPEAARRAREEAEQMEIARIQAEERALVDRFINRDGE